ncbi:MAG: hypothetical protein Kow00114_07140 [Kiloniellaceae bacterium]
MKLIGKVDPAYGATPVLLPPKAAQKVQVDVDIEPVTAGAPSGTAEDCPQDGLGIQSHGAESRRFRVPTPWANAGTGAPAMASGGRRFPQSAAS